jgi:hypothetical protein
MFLKIIKLVSKAAKILRYGEPFPIASFSYLIASLPHACLFAFIVWISYIHGIQKHNIDEKVASY